MNKTLVIGYGNTLRRDDAAGVYAAERIEQRYPGVECLTVQQLTSDMAVTLAHYRTVVFIDASTTAKELRVTKLRPTDAMVEYDSHSMTPQMLLNASNDLYGLIPRETVQIEIPANDFTLGELPSPNVRAIVDQCVNDFQQLVFPATF
ncbi:MAG: hydrogenase maturation protease [Ignavibacteriales bacterium]|nr:hydrogenase maturation protease [Ignavibacteriales bacterium]